MGVFVLKSQGISMGAFVLKSQGISMGAFVLKSQGISMGAFLIKSQAQGFIWSNYICLAYVPLSIKSNSSSTSHVFLYIMVGRFVHLLSSEFQLVVCLYCFQIHTDGLSDFALKQNHGQGCAVWKLGKVHAVWKLNSWYPMMRMPNWDI
jgi:hypothetical protein